MPAQAGALTRHERRHSETAPHKCGVCGAGFATPDEAAAHARKRHTDERPYGCDVCHAAFAAAISLTAHKRTHAVPRV